MKDYGNEMTLSWVSRYVLNIVGKSPYVAYKGLVCYNKLSLSLISIYLHVHEILSTNQAPTQQP